MIRIQKILAQNGVGSRRHVEALIQQNRIKVNGNTATLGMQISKGDSVEIDNALIDISWESGEIEVLAFNKPTGTLCSTKSQGGNDTVFSYFPKPKSGKWSLVGRLDLDTSGLLLITNSGDLANKLMHPKSRVPRYYIVQVSGHPTAGSVKRTKEGILDEGEMLIFSSVQKIGQRSDSTTYKVCLHQGKNREIRRVWQAIGHKVTKLHRYKYGPIALPKELTRGETHPCTKEEIEKLSNL